MECESGPIFRTRIFRIGAHKSRARLPAPADNPNRESAQIVNAVIFRVVALNLSSKDVLCKEHLDIFNAIHGTLMPDAEQPFLSS